MVQTHDHLNFHGRNTNPTIGQQIINSCLEDIHFILVQAFAKKSHQLDMALFDSLWTLLSSVQTFKVGEELNIQQLTTFYEQIKTNLTFYLNDWQSQLKIEKPLSKKTVNLFMQIVLLYQALAKLHFLASSPIKKLEPHWSSQSAQLNNARNDVRHLLQNVTVAPLESEIKSYSQTLHKIVSFINQGYGKIAIAFAEYDIKSRDESSYLKTIKQILMQLPETTLLNSKIERLCQATETANYANISVLQHELKADIKQIKELKNDLMNCLKTYNHIMQQNLNQLSDHTSEIAERLAYIKQQYEQLEQSCLLNFFNDNETLTYDCFMLTNILQESTDAGKKLANACEALDKETTLFNIKKIWTETGASINKLLQKNEEFFKTTTEFNTNRKIIRYQMKDDQQKYDQIDYLKKQLEMLMHHSHEVMNRLPGIFANVEQTLGLFAETNFDFLKAFFAHHWFKLLLGSVSGAGTGTLLAALTTFSPLGLAILMTAGAATGMSLAGGVGLTYDQIQLKKMLKKQNEEQPSENSGWRKFFFWRKTEPRLAATINSQPADPGLKC